MDKTLEKDHISKMIEVIMKVVRGDYSTQIKFSGKDNTLDALGMAINMMVDNVRNSIKEIKKGRNYTENIIKSMIDILIVTDSKGKIKTVNQVTLSLLGYREDELVGKPAGILFAAKEEIPFKGTKMKKLVEEGSIRDCNINYKTKSGEKIPVSFSGSVMRDKDGNLEAIIGIAHDMRKIKHFMEKEKEVAVTTTAAEAKYRTRTELEKTYQKLEMSQDVYLDIMEDLERYHKELNGAIQELQVLRETQAKLIQTEKMAALGQLGAGTAHELNNPLSEIIGFTEMILDDIKNKMVNPDEILHDLETILQEAYRCKNIIINFLNYTRSKEPDIVENDINSIVEETLSIVERQYKLKNIKVFKKYGQGLPKVPVDRNKMIQVFVNIISNAQKAMPDGGKIVIKTWLKNDYIAIQFKDTGMGIEKENISKVFNPFFTTYNPEKGTGVGLSVSYGIVKKHGGDIEVKSEGKDKGASFIVKIPVCHRSKAHTRTQDHH